MDYQRHDGQKKGFCLLTRLEGIGGRGSLSSLRLLLRWGYVESSDSNDATAMMDTLKSRVFVVYKARVSQLLDSQAVK